MFLDVGASPADRDVHVVTIRCAVPRDQNQYEFETPLDGGLGTVREWMSVVTPEWDPGNESRVDLWHPISKENDHGG